MEKTLFVIYVADQERSRVFYQSILEKEPVLDVPGMTEFMLTDSAALGIMPEQGIAKILGDAVPHPQDGNGIPRCELYLFVDDPSASYQLLLDAGGKPINSPEVRPWGDLVSYGVDPDGHIIAFACAVFKDPLQ